VVAVDPERDDFVLSAVLHRASFWVRVSSRISVSRNDRSSVGGNMVLALGGVKEPLLLLQSIREFVVVEENNPSNRIMLGWLRDPRTCAS